MIDSVNLEVLSTRAGFNSVVKHVKKTVEIAGEAESSNLGDILYEMDHEEEEITSYKIGIMLRMLLVDKLGYKSVSANLSETVDDLSVLAKEFSKWNGVDLVAVYHHPELGLLIANPKVEEELSGFGELRKRELLVVYAGLQGNETNDDCDKAAKLALSLFQGEKVTIPPALTKGKFTVKKVSKPGKEEEAKPAKVKAAKPKADTKKTAAPTAAKITAAEPKAAAGSIRMTPRYAVVVQNELFHNGNVEAWKKIVASYKVKYPALEVYIYYEGERILDINSLFKWGKVKHGTAIEFAIAGNEIKDVAKLQRYLTQGASKMFEAFLRGPVNSVLKLF